MSVASLSRFGLDASEGEEIKAALTRELGDWVAGRRDRFPDARLRKAAPESLGRAETVVPERTTLGAPKAWGSIDFAAEEEQRYRQVLYENNLDLLFHRICYWADGERSVLDIVERLEFELDELLRDTSIARTSSGFLIDGAKPIELDLDAVLYMVDCIARGGFLKLR